MKSVKCLSVLVLVCGLIFIGPVYAGCGACGGGGGHVHKKADEGAWKRGAGTSCFGDVCSLAEEKGGVKEITYEQFRKIRNSGEPYVLIDALSAESYANGHIPGAISFPYKTIDNKTAPKRLSRSDNIIVYCGGFKCAASTKAAHRLLALGYKNVVDYKGGLEDWTARGNDLAKD
jgi:rhodanese-related sulfurtransferase